MLIFDKLGLTREKHWLFGKEFVIKEPLWPVYLALRWFWGWLETLQAFDTIRSYFSYLQTSTGENILFHPVYVFFFIYSRSIFKVFAYYSLLTSVLGIWSLSLSVGCSVVSRQVPLSMEFSRQEYWSG